MNYKEFIEKAAMGVQNRLGEAYQVDFHAVKKNNGIIADAICVGNKEEHIRVNVYVDEFYQDYLQHGDLEKSVSEIMSFVKDYHIPKEQGEDMRQIISKWEAVKGYVRPALLSKSKNQELLQDMPRCPFLDLAIVYMIHIPQEEMHGVIKINRGMIKLWGIGMEELHQTAMENQKGEGYEIKSLGDIINSMGVALEEEVSEDLELCPMYVLSNQENFYGAAGILDNSLLAEFAERVKRNLFLLPASIHEFIIVLDEGKTNVEELNEMVREINESVVGTQEVLEDHVYYFDRGERKIKMPE